MSYEALQVTAAHLRELAAKHGQAAAEIATATESVSGVDRAISTSHGVIARSTAAAVEAIQLARRDAGNSVARASDGMGENLTSAADRYEATDRASGANIEQRLRLGQSASAPQLRR